MTDLAAPPLSAETGAGSVWPAAVLLGAAGSAILAGGTWIGAALAGGGTPMGAADWVAEHALAGTLVGVAVTLVLRAVAPLHGFLRDGAQRRACAARVVLLAVVAVHGALVAGLVLGGREGVGPLLGVLAGAAALAAGLRCCLRVSYHLGDLPRLCPIRVAAGVGLLTLPLTASLSGGGGSLIGAWRVMLGG